MLRLRKGEAVVASDGAGSWVPCRWQGGALDPDGQVRTEPSPSPVAVGFVPTKGDRPEWVVQRCTELGVDRIVVLSSERSVVRWEGERAASHLARLAAAARRAGMQSRRVRLPAVEGVLPLASLGSAGAGWALAVPDGPPPSAGCGGVLVGPEGGWSPGEEAACDLPRVGLGPAILRAETAALAGAAVLVALRSGLVAPVGAG